MNEFDFHNWILKQNDTRWTLSEKDERHIDLETPAACAHITFYAQDIVEFRITRKKDGEDCFYLHFQAKHPDHACELFHEMTESLLRQSASRKIRVLFCCSSGLTTGFFVQKMNEAEEVLQAGYEYRAVDVSRLYELGFAYDVIVLAPQIQYLYPKAAEVLHDQLVLKMPASIFAAYDVKNAIEFIDEERRNARRKKEAGRDLVGLHPISTDRKILVIGVRLDYPQTRILYRIFDQGRSGKETAVRKDRLSLQDIEDVLDTVLAFDDDIDAVCISMPGILSEGCVNLPASGLNHFNLRGYLNARYSPRFVIVNNANAVAVGLSFLKKQASLVYYSQPRGSQLCGTGTVLNYHLIQGKNGVAGELQYLWPAIGFSEGIEKRLWTPVGACEIAARYLLAVISITGPQDIYVRCDLIPETHELKRWLKNWIPEEYIPRLHAIADTHEWMAYGELILCLNALSIQNEKQ